MQNSFQREAVGPSAISEGQTDELGPCLNETVAKQTTEKTNIAGNQSKESESKRRKPDLPFPFNLISESSSISETCPHTSTTEHVNSKGLKLDSKMSFTSSLGSSVAEMNTVFSSLTPLASNLFPSTSSSASKEGSSCKSAEMNFYLQKLKKMVPYAKNSPKLSKVQLIHCAIDYITDLQEALEARVKKKRNQQALSASNRAPLADLSVVQQNNSSLSTGLAENETTNVTSYDTDLVSQGEMSQRNSLLSSGARRPECPADYWHSINSDIQDSTLIDNSINPTDKISEPACSTRDDRTLPQGGSTAGSTCLSTDKTTNAFSGTAFSFFTGTKYVESNSSERLKQTSGCDEETEFGSSNCKKRKLDDAQ